MAHEPQFHLEGGVKRKRNSKAIEPEVWATQVKTCPFCSSQEAQFKYLNNKKLDQPRYKCLRLSPVPCGKLFSPHMIRPKRFLQGYKKSSEQELLVDDMLLTQNKQLLQDADTDEEMSPSCDQHTEQISCDNCDDVPSQQELLVDVKQNQRVLQDADTDNSSGALSQTMLPICRQLEEQISSDNCDDVPSQQELVQWFGEELVQLFGLQDTVACPFSMYR